MSLVGAGSLVGVHHDRRGDLRPGRAGGWQRDLPFSRYLTF
jgi:hypothetical protein